MKNSIKSKINYGSTNSITDNIILATGGSTTTNSSHYRMINQASTCEAPANVTPLLIEDESKLIQHIGNIFLQNKSISKFKKRNSTIGAITDMPLVSQLNHQLKHIDYSFDDIEQGSYLLKLPTNESR